MFIVIAASTFGFLGALVGYFIFGIPLIAALAIWILSGPSAALLLIMGRALRRPAKRGIPVRHA